MPEDIDECRDRTAVCHKHAICENAVGSYRCTCKQGYYGNDGKDCIPKGKFFESMFILRCLPIIELIIITQTQRFWGTEAILQAMLFQNLSTKRIDVFDIKLLSKRPNNIILRYKCADRSAAWKEEGDPDHTVTLLWKAFSWFRYLTTCWCISFIVLKALHDFIWCSV